MARALLMLVIVLLGACTTNPYTHRSQLNLMSEDEEIRIEQQARRSFQKKRDQAKANGNLIAENDPRYKSVERILVRIIAAAERSRYRETAKRFHWDFILVENEEANAHCAPGGKITIYTGILPFTKNEAGLAAVIGHEVTHALAHHSAEDKSQEDLAQLGMEIVNGIMEYNNVKRNDRRQTTETLERGVELGVLLPYSREQESEADYIGLLLAADAGYDPREAPKVWQRMKNDGGQEFLSTHPSHGTRIKQLKQWMPEALHHYEKSKQRSE